jgi:hypothetical protein
MSAKNVDETAEIFVEYVKKFKLEGRAQTEGTEGSAPSVS